MAAASRQQVWRVLEAVGSASCRCPMHSMGVGRRTINGTATTVDYAFEMAASAIRVGAGVTKEIGMEWKNRGMKNVCLVTDQNMSKLAPVKTAIQSLEAAGVHFQVFDRVRVEPDDESMQDMISFAREHNFDGFLAIGGGSVMDTAKVGNLYSVYPGADFLDFVNAPVGKGLPIHKSLKPLIAVPTTSGTGSETTGVAIFDYHPLKAKTGIANRQLRPTLGLIDPLHTLTMPRNVTVYSAFDILCHAMESYTAIPYNQRSPCPSNPALRPAYQGANPISDIWSIHALKMVAKHLKQVVSNPEDLAARTQMHLASCYAGIGFGNAGVHLCHGMSYPIAGGVKNFHPEGYNVKHAIVPHGLSVIMSAPAVFKFTGAACPERHLELAAIMGADISNAKSQDAGIILSDTLKGFMKDLNVENGLKGLGYSRKDIGAFVAGTLPQERVTRLSPTPVGAEELALLFEESLTLW